MNENTENMQCDETYNPDLLTWGNLHNIDDSIGNINVSLTAIDNRIKEWLAEQSEG